MSSESTVAAIDDERAMLTVVEAARWLRISRNLAYELVNQGQIPSVRLGRVIRVPRWALEAWIGDEASRSEPRTRL